MATKSLFVDTDYESERDGRKSNQKRTTSSRNSSRSGYSANRSQSKNEAALEGKESTDKPSNGHGEEDDGRQIVRNTFYGHCRCINDKDLDLNHHWLFGWLFMVNLFG